LSFDHEHEVVRQPAVYPFAGHLARGFGCTTLLDFGIRDVARLANLADEFEIVGVGAPETVTSARERCPHGQWVEWDFASDLALPVETARTAIVCSNVLEHLSEPSALLDQLTRLAGEAAAVIVSTEGSLERVEAGIDVDGLTLDLEDMEDRNTSLAVLAGPEDAATPAGFSVVAFMTAFNEADIIGSTVEHFRREGVGVYLIDNWSSDGTWELAQALDLVGAERFPQHGPTEHYEWRQLLRRVEELAATADADWLVHADADEHRESAWPGVSLRDGLWRVERRSFNAVDHTVLTFPPVDDGFSPGTDPGRYFRHFEFGRNPGHFFQIKAWKRPGRVELAASGGHTVSFAGQRVFPYNFLSKHYPVRSQAHGERKIFQERHTRWASAERADGWHIQYDTLQPGHRFARDPKTLEPFDDDFYRRYLVERLTRIGIPRPDWPPR
jgi:hypothetical protein